MSHYILDCPIYAQHRLKILPGILSDLCPYSDPKKTIFLLAALDANTSHRMPLYALALRKIQVDAVSMELINTYFMDNLLLSNCFIPWYIFHIFHHLFLWFYQILTSILLFISILYLYLALCYLWVVMAYDQTQINFYFLSTKLD